MEKHYDGRKRNYVEKLGPPKGVGARIGKKRNPWKRGTTKVIR
jgi:hypothetical protein